MILSIFNAIRLLLKYIFILIILSVVCEYVFLPIFVMRNTVIYLITNSGVVGYMWIQSFYIFFFCFVGLFLMQFIFWKD